MGRMKAREALLRQLVADAAANAEELRRELRVAFAREGLSLIDARVNGSVEAQQQEMSMRCEY